MLFISFFKNFHFVHILMKPIFYLNSGTWYNSQRQLYRF